MLSFFVKKAFFDGWDHLFGLVLLNLGFVVILGLAFFVPGLVGGGALVFYLSLAPFVLLGAVWWSLCVHALSEVADYGDLSFRTLPALLKKALVPGLQYGVMGILVTLALGIGLPFYLSRGGLLGAAAAGLLLWGSIFFLLALQWYLPLRVRLGGGFLKNLKKAFIIFFDNAFFSVFLFVWTILSLALSVVLALLIPGLAGIALGLDDALKLRLYKYDWLEAHPGAKRSDLPWEELLTEDKELLGPRSLKNMIFPWKY